MGHQPFWLPNAATVIDNRLAAFVWEHRIQNLPHPFSEESAGRCLQSSQFNHLAVRHIRSFCFFVNICCMRTDTVRIEVHIRRIRRLILGFSCFSECSWKCAFHNHSISRSSLLPMLLTVQFCRSPQKSTCLRNYACSQKVSWVSKTLALWTLRSSPTLLIPRFEDLNEHPGRCLVISNYNILRYWRTYHVLSNNKPKIWDVPPLGCN